MARRNDLRQPEDIPTAFVASAVNVTKIKSVVAPRSQNSAWQKQLWDMYDVVGEFEYVANWVGNLLSKARLYAAKSGKEIKNGPAVDAVDELFGTTKADVLRALGIHSTVSGESYIFTYMEGDERMWEVYSPHVVSKSAGYWQVDGEAVPTTELMVIRTWQRHPAKPKEATSPSRAALGTLNEIHTSTMHIDAQLKSRLASAGLLLLPNEIAFSAGSTSEGDDTQNASKADSFVRELTRVMAANIANRDDASALVPIVVTADGEHLDKARLLEFWSALDEKVLDMRDKAITRLGLALDVPPEILTGTGDISHWQAWGVDEASVKAHTEPLLKRITDDLTRGYLWPALKGLVPDEDLHRYTIEADTSEMRLRPNRSEESITLWDRGLVKDATVRRESGFSDEDAPSKAEREDWTRRKVALAAIDPTMTAIALETLGVQDAPEVDPVDPRPEEPTPAPVVDIETHKPVPSEAEKDDLMDDAERKSAALIAAAEQMVFRALERAGNRAKSKLKAEAPEGTEAPELYLFRKNTDAEASFMLDGSFGHVERFSQNFDMRPSLLAWTLEDFCRDLIVNGKPYTRAALCAALQVEVPSA